PNHKNLAWECIGQHQLVVALPSMHPLAKKAKVKMEDLKGFFFVAMSETTHPGSHAWLRELCQHAGFGPRVLQAVELESDLMVFVADGLGVTLAREQIRNLPHPGVVFRPLAPTVKSGY